MMQLNHTLTQLREERDAAISRAEKAERETLEAQRRHIGTATELAGRYMCERDAALADAARLREALVKAKETMCDFADKCLEAADALKKGGDADQAKYATGNASGAQFCAAIVSDTLAKIDAALARQGGGE